MILLVSCTILARAVNLTKMNELRFYNRTVVAQLLMGAVRAATVRRMAEMDLFPTVH